MNFDINRTSEIERVAIPELKKIQAREERRLLSRNAAAAANTTDMVTMFIDIAGFHDQTAAFMASYQEGKTPPHKFALFDQAGHLVASLLTFVPAARPVQLAINPLVFGTTTFRMLAELKDGKKINHNDVLTLVSDAVGVVAVVAVITGATATAGVAIAIGVTISAYQILDSRFGLWDAFKTTTRNQIAIYHPPPYEPFPDLLYGYHGYMTPFSSISPSNPGIAKVIVTGSDGRDTVYIQPRYDSHSADPYPFAGVIPDWPPVGNCPYYLRVRNQCDLPDDGQY